jgi:hypothetical protein
LHQRAKAPASLYVLDIIVDSEIMTRWRNISPSTEASACDEFVAAYLADLNRSGGAV